MTITEQAQTITTAPNFYSIGEPLEAIARGLYAEALAYGIPTVDGRKAYVHAQLVRMDSLCGWDIENRPQWMEELIYKMLAEVAHLAYVRGV